METKSVKITECFQIKGIGLMTELQHWQDGIPPNTKLIDPASGDTWLVKKRVLSGTLLVAGSETHFDCETEFTHISPSFKSVKDRQLAVDRELEKRKNGMYWYVLVAEGKNQTDRPSIGRVLRVEKGQQKDSTNVAV